MSRFEGTVADYQTSEMTAGVIVVRQRPGTALKVEKEELVREALAALPPS